MAFTRVIKNRFHNASSGESPLSTNQRNLSNGIHMHLSNDQYQSDTHEFATDNCISIDACTCPKCDYEHVERITSVGVSGAVNVVTISRCLNCGYHSKDDDSYRRRDVLRKKLAMIEQITFSLSMRGFVKGELITEYKLYALTHAPEYRESTDCLLKITLPEIAKMTPKRPMRERVLNAA